MFYLLGVEPKAGLIQPGVRLNEGEAKLRDTRLMRVVRAMPIAGPKVSGWSLARQNRVGKKFGLRRAFSGPIMWTPELRTRVINHLADDTQQFLDFIDRPISVWPRIERLMVSANEHNPPIVWKR
jgi:hypothetical protein